MLELLTYILVRGSVGTLNLLPLCLRHFVVHRLICVVVAFSPKYRAIAGKNLEIAFPDLDLSERRLIFRKSLKSLARVIVDFARLPALNDDWIREHVECPFLPRYLEIQRESKQGVIIATGHLGSFELIARSAPVFAGPVSFVVRDFKHRVLNEWVRKIRQQGGNFVISRKGAVPAIIKRLNNGSNVGILFDQNVTKNHAVFVPWFGVPAATTRALGLIALRLKARVLVASITYLDNERYRINFKECDFTAVYEDEKMSAEEKLRAVTYEASTIYQEMIRENPTEWFWLHRRWKTRPDGEEKIYD